MRRRGGTDAEGPDDLLRATGAGTLVEAEMIVALLVDNDIPALVRRMNGFDVPSYLSGGPRDVCVRRDQLEAAMALIESHFGLDRPFA